MTYEELLQFKEFSEAHLLAGQSGLQNTITGAHVIEMADGSNWNNPGELIFTSGVGFTDSVKELNCLFETLADNQASGLVIEIGPYIQDVPTSIISKADQAGIPLFTIPYRVPITAIIAKIYYLVYRQQEYHQTVEQQLTDILTIGSDDSIERFQAEHLKTGQKYVVMYLACADHPAKEGIEILKNALRHLYSPGKQTFFCPEQNGVVLITALSEHKFSLHNTADNLVKTIEKTAQLFSPGIRINTGVGDIIEDAEHIILSVQQSKLALDMLLKCKGKDSYSIYSDLGIYQLLYLIKDTDALQRIVKTQLGELLSYDLDNDGTLVQTYRVFLEEGQSITQTALRLFVHRSTVKYRIKRIKELTGKNFQDSNQIFHDQLAFKILQYLGEA